MINLLIMRKNRDDSYPLESIKRKEQRRFDEGWYKGFTVCAISTIIGVAIGIYKERA